MSNWLDKLVCDEDSDPNILLLQVKAHHIFAMDDVGYRIEDRFEQILKPLETGFWRPGEVFPVDTKKIKGLKSNRDSTIYYYDFKEQRHLPMPGAADEEVTISNRRDTFLLEKPTVPSRGIQVMLALFEIELDKIAPYRKFGQGEKRLMNLFTTDLSVEALLDDLHPLVHDDILDLHKFIGDDVWYIYGSKIYGSAISVEKIVDYRVYDWHVQRAEKRTPAD